MVGGQHSGEHRRGPQKGRLPHYSCPIAGVEVCHLASLVRSKLPMFDSSFFLARTEEGVVAPARLGQDGRYHVEGESVFAPKDLLVPAHGEGNLHGGQGLQQDHHEPFAEMPEE